MPRILFVHPGKEMSTFVAQDHYLLARRAEVTTLPWRRAADLGAVARLLSRHDLVFTWFLSHHAAACALLASLLRKPSLAVAGGEEVTPPALLGSAPWRARDRWATRTALERTSLVLALSAATLKEASFLRRPGARSELRLLHAGIDTDRFRPLGPKEDLVLTVAILFAESARRKRLNLFAETARLVPEARFVIAGPDLDGTGELLRQRSPENLLLPGQPSPDDLLSLFQRARVYVQPSLHEAFGIANAEAMACGCVPVVTRAGALPEVVGDAGFYLDHAVPEELARAVRAALRSDLGPRARARVVERFARARRERSLWSAVEDALSGRLKPGVEAISD